MCGEFLGDPLESYDKDTKTPWVLWLYRDQRGRWHRQPNLDLLDIGDFDGDGKSEGVYFAGYPIPHGEWALISFQDFDIAISASDEGF
jgi:hypothetical protein